jgi:hypothetical protein
MAQRQRDQSIVASHIQIEFQLLAPGTAVPHQGTAGRTGPLFGQVQCSVQFTQSVQAGSKHGLV